MKHNSLLLDLIKFLKGQKRLVYNSEYRPSLTNSFEKVRILP